MQKQGIDIQNNVRHTMWVVSGGNRNQFESSLATLWHFAEVL